MANQLPPPDDRLDGPIHSYFELSYANYLVIPRTLLQSMPVEWQERFVADLEQLRDAFADVEQAPCYQVTAASQSDYGSLSEVELKRLGVTTVDRADGPVFYDAYGVEHHPGDRVLVPQSDPVPDYDRGRTYLPPTVAR